MAPPPLTGKSLILHPRILPNGAGADTIGAVIAKCPSGALHPGVSGDDEGGDYDDRGRTGDVQLGKLSWPLRGKGFSAAVAETG